MCVSSFIRQLQFERKFGAIPPEPSEDEVEYGLLILKEMIEKGNYSHSHFALTLWRDHGCESAVFVKKLSGMAVRRYATELIETQNLATELDGKTPSELYQFFFGHPVFSSFRFSLVDQLTGSTDWQKTVLFPSKEAS